jgi:hypothetical protein
MILLIILRKRERYEKRYTHSLYYVSSYDIDIFSGMEVIDQYK